MRAGGLLGLQSIPWYCPVDQSFSFGLVPTAYSNPVWCSLPQLRLGTHFHHSAHSYSVAQALHSFCLRTVLATVKGAFLFEPVTDDVNATILASRSECMDCTLEAVECVSNTTHGHLKRLIVVVSAGFASWHDGLPIR